MDNQQTTPDGSLSNNSNTEPNNPISASEPTTAPTTAEPTTTAESATPSLAPTTQAEATPTKKKKTKLLVLVIMAILILIGGGAFATYAVIKNTPENILLDSINNLATAKNVAIDGSLKVTYKEPEESSPFYSEYSSFDTLRFLDVEYYTIRFDATQAQINQNATVSLQIKFKDGKLIDNLKIGEVTLNGDTLYLQINGIEKIYKENIKEYLSYYATMLENEEADLILSTIDDIVAKIDGQWYEFSYEGILEDDFLNSIMPIPESVKQEYYSARDCVVEKLNNMPIYSNELFENYKNNKFINLFPSQNDYYLVFINFNNLASYMNNISNLKLYQDALECIDSSQTYVSRNTVSAEELESSLEQLPDIYLHFDGFLNHHLTDIKMNYSNDFTEYSTDIHLTYPSNVQINAPSDSKPIMELVKEVYNTITDIIASLQ